MRGNRVAMIFAMAGAMALGTTALAAAAPGDVQLDGQTSDGVKVKLTVAGAGNATAFKIGKTEVTCAEGGTLTNNAGTYTGFDTSEPGRFADRRTSSSDDGKYHFETKAGVAGQVAEGDSSWSGTFKLKTTVFKHHEEIDTCKLRSTWTAA
jgi:hypothetical protein